MPRVVHFEIHADDPERAAEFYRKTFDWDIRKWADSDYWLVTTGAEIEPGINGGILKRRNKRETGGTSAYICTINVPSVDKYVKRVKDNGGGLSVPKISIPNVGWLCYCADTEGNSFGLLEGHKETD